MDASIPALAPEQGHNVISAEWPQWLQPNANGLVLLAGPCSAESPEQLLATARALAPLGIQALRAGVWKPRSRPGNFEGQGEAALAWLQAVRAETGLRIAVEVADAKMAEAALLAGADVVWVGARTMVNPFVVEEIAQAMAGAGVVTLAKNPINPDLGLWLGGLERLHRRKTGPLGACHRGFSYYGEMRYRNLPQWEIPLELRRQWPELPLLCDPSHIAGTRALVAEVAQTALSLGFDGLMVEVHSAPQEALSDAAQQLTPQEFALLLTSLQRRKPTGDDAHYQYALGQLRAQIDDIDAQLLDLLARRMQAAAEIGQLKEAHTVRQFQFERWRRVLDSRRQLATQLGLRPEFVSHLYKLLHLEALRQQNLSHRHTPVGG